MTKAIKLTTAALLTAALLLPSCSNDQKTEKPGAAALSQSELIRELISMAQQSEQVRNRLDSIVNEKGWRSPEGQQAAADEVRLDSLNIARLEEIIAAQGWPGRTKVGADAATAAFVILQHASVETQEKYYPMLESASQRREVEKAHVAMLRDRILMRRDKPQLYGTQLWNDPSNGKLGLYPIEDSANVDQRRAEVGLPPLADYIRSFGIEPESLSQRSKTTITIEPIRPADSGK